MAISGHPYRRVLHQISTNRTIEYDPAMSNLYVSGWHAYNTEFRISGSRFKPGFPKVGPLGPTRVASYRQYRFLAKVSPTRPAAALPRQHAPTKDTRRPAAGAWCTRVHAYGCMCACTWVHIPHGCMYFSSFPGARARRALCLPGSRPLLPGSRPIGYPISSSA